MIYLEIRLKDVRQYNIVTNMMIYKCIDEIGGYAYSKASFSHFFMLVGTFQSIIFLICLVCDYNCDLPGIAKALCLHFSFE
jgi:hypothetical protein